jgi:hypothetical protein
VEGRAEDVRELAVVAVAISIEKAATSADRLSTALCDRLPPKGRARTRLKNSSLSMTVS